MAEHDLIHHRQRNPKFGSGGSFGSDADSGYDDPGVITIPVVRTTVRNDSNGRKVSTTSTEWVSVKKNEDKTTNSASDFHSENPSRAENQIKGSSKTEKNRTKSVTKTKPTNLPQHNKTSSPTLPREKGNDNDFRVTKFSKEVNNDNESQKTYRFVARMREGFSRPVIRDVTTSNNTILQETTIKRVPRRRIRSKSADSRRNGPQNLFSATYSKVLSPETMRKRKLIADILRKKCILEEEYYKLPYEEINREIALCLYSSSETRLNEIKSLQDHDDENWKVEVSDLIFELAPSEKLDVGFLRCQNEKMFGKDFGSKLQQLQNNSAQFPEPESPTLTSARSALQKLLLDINSDSELEDDKYSKNIDNKNSKETLKNQEKNTFVDQTEFIKDHHLPNSELLANKGTKESFKPSLSYSNSTGNSNENLSDSPKERSSFSNLKTDRKKKYKKNVSFSAENEEMYFNSSMSDSDSSVFEDINLELPQENLNEEKLQGNKTTFEDDSGAESIAGDIGMCYQNPPAHNTKQPLNDNSNLYCFNNKFKAYPTSSIQPDVFDLINGNTNREIRSDPISGNLVRENRVVRNKAKYKFLNGSQNNFSWMEKDFEQNNNSNKNFPKSSELNNKNQNIHQVFNLPSKNFNKSRSKENERNNNSKKTQNNAKFKGDTVNIFMTRGSSFTDHEIQLRTHTSSEKPNVTVTRFKVPFSTIRDQWNWATPIMVAESQKFDSFYNFQNMSPLPTTPQIVSPTPSCGSSNSIGSSSGCYSASCSPSPSPTRVKGVFIPTSL